MALNKSLRYLRLGKGQRALTRAERGRKRRRDLKRLGRENASVRIANAHNTESTPVSADMEITIKSGALFMLRN